MYVKRFPVECKKSATIDKDAVRNFGKLATFKQPIGKGTLISLFPELTHLKEDVLTIPAAAL